MNLPAGMRCISFTDIAACSPIPRAPVDKVAVIRRLVAVGAAVDAQGMQGFAPLHFAAIEGDAAAVEALLEAGADPLVNNSLGDRPFHLCPARGPHQRRPIASAG